MQVLAKNRKLGFNYEILETFEAGIELLGTEVKTLKSQGVNLLGTYIAIQDNQAFWINAKIKPYQSKNLYTDYDESRKRRLLLKKGEINYLIGKTKEKGLTLMPVMLYTKRGFIKLELALVRGKKSYDKRKSNKKREINRRIKLGGD